MPDPAQLISDGPYVYLAVFALVMLDAVLPIAPSETLLVSGGVLVTAGDLTFVPLVLAGAAGALAGHLLLYVLGTHAGAWMARKVVRGPDRDQRIEWAGRQLRERTWILIVADFVPFGRTILMFSAGALGLAMRRFLAFASVGAVVWATFYTTLGLVGGSVFESRWYGLAASLIAAFAFILILEIAQRLIRRRALAKSGGSGSPAS